MREIKFRAWDIEGSKMYYDAQDTYDYMHGKPESIPAIYFGELLENDQWEVMQYTGLHDKNGKEIYEGDIAKFHRPGYGDSPKYTVGFVQGSFCFDSKTEIEYMHEMRLDYCEIIGNIYENPDLIK